MRVLVVDDNRMVCRCLKEQIEWERIGLEKPQIAFNGLDALRLIEENKPDIVISDVRMPGMDGTELCRQISENWPEITILFMSAYEDFAAAQMAIRYNVKDYILKPLDRERLEELEHILHTVVKKRTNVSFYKQMISDHYLEEIRHKQDYRVLSLIQESDAEGSAIIKEIQKIVQEQFTTPDLNIQKLGRVFHMSPKYLGRIYMENTGIKLVDYIGEKRMQYACEQLRTSVKTIKEIAESAGYTDANYFARTFKRKMNMTPMEYRAKYQKLDHKILWEESQK